MPKRPPVAFQGEFRELCAKIRRQIQINEAKLLSTSSMTDDGKNQLKKVILALKTDLKTKKKSYYESTKQVALNNSLALIEELRAFSVDRITKY